MQQMFLLLSAPISGEDNAEIPHPIIFRGAVYADTARFDKCTALWMRAMHLRFKNNRSVAKDLIRFGQVRRLLYHVNAQKEVQDEKQGQAQN